jgi:putative ABC transport system permease protein
MISAKDFSVAFGSLRKNLGYLLTIVLTLGITLGALVAMFNLNYQILAAPLPYPDAERLYLMHCATFRNAQPESLGVDNIMPYPLLVESYKQHSEHIEHKALVNFYVDAIRGLPDTPQVNTSYITPEYLQMLQPPMSMGRVFAADEGLDAQAPVTVISFKTWREIFHSDPEILGKTLRFGAVDFKIIGVTAEHFSEPQLVGLAHETQVWLPWDYNLVPPGYRGWSGFVDREYLVVKLKPGTNLNAAEQDLSVRLNGRFQEENAAVAYFSGFSLGFTLMSYQRVIMGDSKTRILMLLAGALVLLLIAAANIVNLMLARAASQQRTMAIKAALGAQKWHLFSGLLAEILYLMALASLLSLVVALGGIALLKMFASSYLPRLAELQLSWPSMLFALVAALLLAVSFALMVSHQVNYRALNMMLQTSGKGVGIQISARVRRLLILVQVVLAGILLTINVQILQQSLQHIAQPLGMALENIHELELNIGLQSSSLPEERKRNLMAIRAELLASPKVENASLTNFFPIGQNSAGADYGLISAAADFSNSKRALLTFTDERYLKIYAIPLLLGRHFDAREFQEDTHVIIINETFARSLQADGQVLGKRYYAGMGDPYEVIGIVRDLSLPGVAEEPRMFMPQANVDFPRILLQLKPNQAFTKEELNQLMARVNSQYKVAIFLSMTHAQARLLAQARLSAALTTALALLTLLLASLGIYGVLSYSVLLRRFELGIRMAIGAGPRTIFMKVLRDNIVPVLVGLALAFILLVALWGWVQARGYDAGLTLWVCVGPAALILLLVTIACLVSVWNIIRRPAILALQNH